MGLKISVNYQKECQGKDFPIRAVGIDTNGDLWISDFNKCVAIGQYGYIEPCPRSEWATEPITLLPKGTVVTLTVE